MLVTIFFPRQVREFYVIIKRHDFQSKLRCALSAISFKIDYLNQKG